MKNLISHSGKVVSVSDTHVFVQVERNSACSGCKNKGACRIGDAKNEIISVKTADANTYSANEVVEVLMRTSLGLKAVLYAYVFPFIFLLTVLLTVRQFISSEILQVLFAFIPVIVYYIVLYHLHGKIEQSFQFNVKKNRNL
jgi:sigma-E factor negative regulatory protein RseC